MVGPQPWTKGVGTVRLPEARGRHCLVPPVVQRLAFVMSEIITSSGKFCLVCSKSHSGLLTHFQISHCLDMLQCITFGSSISAFCLSHEECLLRLYNQIEVRCVSSNREHQCVYVVLP